MLQAVITKDVRALVAPTMAPIASKATIDVVQPGGYPGMGPGAFVPTQTLPPPASSPWPNVLMIGGLIFGGLTIGLLLYKVVRK